MKRRRGVSNLMSITLLIIMTVSVAAIYFSGASDFLKNAGRTTTFYVDTSLYRLNGDMERGNTTELYRRKVVIQNGNDYALEDYILLVEPGIYNEDRLILSHHFNGISLSVPNGVPYTPDTSGWQRHSKVVGGDPSKIVEGRFGGALSLDGASYVETQELIYNPEGSGIVMWFRYDGDNGVLLSLRDLITNRGYSVLEVVDGDLYLQYICLTPKNLGPVADGWNYIAFTYGGGEVYIRFNDDMQYYTYTCSGGEDDDEYEEDGLGRGVITLDDDEEDDDDDDDDGLQKIMFYIGRATANNMGDGTSYIGLIDEFKLYDRMLTQSDLDGFYTAKAKLDYGDIRFRYEDGREIPYWMERDGYFWIKIDLPPGITTIYIYYGDPTAESRSDFLSVFSDMEDKIYLMSFEWPDDEVAEDHEDFDEAINAGPKLYGSGYVNTTEFTENPFGPDDGFMLRYIFLLYPDSTGLYRFRAEGDDSAELILKPSNRDEYHYVVSYQYNFPAPTEGDMILIEGYPIFMEYRMMDLRGRQYSGLLVKKPPTGGGWRIFSTTFFSGNIYAKVYPEGSEPSTSVGGEESPSTEGKGPLLILTIYNSGGKTFNKLEIYIPGNNEPIYSEEGFILKPGSSYNVKLYLPGIYNSVDEILLVVKLYTEEGEMRHQIVRALHTYYS